MECIGLDSVCSGTACLWNVLSWVGFCLFFSCSSLECMDCDLNVKTWAELFCASFCLQSQDIVELLLEDLW